MADIRSLLLHHRRNAAELAREFGEKEVIEEIDDMMYSDLADKALIAATQLGNRKLAREAARIILNSGGYSPETRVLAAQVLNK